MITSSLGQISNSFPIVVFVLGNRWCVLWRTICVSTNDINAVNCWCCSIVCYSENLIIIYKYLSYSTTISNHRSWITLYRGGPIMSANLVMVGTKYECKNWNVRLEIRPEMRVRNSQRDFRVCTHIKSLLKMFALIFGPFQIKVSSHIWSLLWPSLHTYLVPFKIEFTLIIGPPRYKLWTINNDALFHSAHLLITIASEWVVLCLIPFSSFIVQNFCLKSITWRIATSNKWRISVISQCPDVQMRVLWWWFGYEICSVKTKKNNDFQ